MRIRRHYLVTIMTVISCFSGQERLDIVRDFCNYGLEHWGSDDKGVENTRKFLLEWLSFTHR